jgi:hypothetical protein
LGLLFAFAGLGIGGMVNAGIAMGIVAVGGLALGVVAAGAYAMGAWVPPVTTYESISYYPVGNAPPFLRSLESLLNADFRISQYMVIIVPVYLLMILAVRSLQYREGKRVRSENDWLIDG